MMTCRVCDAELGGPGQREHDLEVFQSRAPAREEEAVQYEEIRAASEAEKARRQEVLEGSRREQRLMETRIARVRLGFAVAAAVVAVLVPIVAYSMHRPGMGPVMVLVVAVMVILSAALAGVSRTIGRAYKPWR
jgi:hypothetical protein